MMLPATAEAAPLYVATPVGPAFQAFHEPEAVAEPEVEADPVADDAQVAQVAEPVEVVLALPY